MQQLVCKNCGYTWQYKGSKTRTSCSKCKTSITVHHQLAATLHHESKRVPLKDQFDKIIVDQKARDANFEVMSGRTGRPKELMDVKFPLALWRDVRLKQRIDHAPSLGEDHIMLKVDKDGILYL